MEKTWRWFGPTDRITLDMLRQIGVQGVVTALHHIPNGQVWPLAEIRALKSRIERHGLRWSVVESLPVSEAIKYGGADRDSLIDNYVESLKHLGQAGVKTVCYNFMPVIDWIRTDLQHPLPDGTSTLYFDLARFAYFDLAILKRPGAAEEYSPGIRERVAELTRTMTAAETQALIDTIIVETQGFVNGNVPTGDNDPVALFRRLLSRYEGIGREQLRSHLRYFLERIMPVCNRYGIRMCVHPDDPPWAVLGLPRIVTCEEDLQWIVDAVDDPHNGITFCAGSLSSGMRNDLPALARRFAARTHFIHLRSTQTFPDGDFIEAPHLEGRAELIRLVRIFEKHDPGLPMRVDHGKLLPGDARKGYHPGYSFHGRMLALGQMEGVIATVRDEIENHLI